MTKLNKITLDEIPSRFRVREATPQPNSEQLKQTVLALKEQARNLLPIEQFEKERLLKQVQSLKRQLADATADRISLGFLKARRHQKAFQVNANQNKDSDVPKFALFTPDSAICSFSINVRVNSDYYLVSTPGSLPDLLGLWDGMPKPLYDRTWLHTQEPPEQRSTRWWEYSNNDIYQYAHNEKIANQAGCLFSVLRYARNTSAYIVSTSFSGGLPDDIRTQIPIWQDLYDQVLICREAADWSVNVIQHPQIFNLDPLVLGRIDDDYWLLAKFDTTSAEEWVSNEWTRRHR